jgi:hypothetical protein
MKNPVQVLLTVARIGGHLSIAGDKLRMLLPADCPPELKDGIRQHKPALLNLMRLTFLTVRSEILEAIVLFVPDETTKESLVAAGADAAAIYTKAELAALVRRQITPEELRLIHAAKQQFNGKVTNPWSPSGIPSRPPKPGTTNDPPEICRP